MMATNTQVTVVQMRTCCYPAVERDLAKALARDAQVRADAWANVDEAGSRPRARDFRPATVPNGAPNVARRGSMPVNRLGFVGVRGDEAATETIDRFRCRHLTNP